MKDLTKLAKSITLESFKSGEAIYKHGEACDKFYFIIQGEVSKNLPNLVYIPKEAREEIQNKANQLIAKLDVKKEELEGLLEREEQLKRMMDPVKRIYDKYYKHQFKEADESTTCNF